MPYCGGVYISALSFLIRAYHTLKFYLMVEIFRPFDVVEVSEFGPPNEPGVYAVCVRDSIKAPEKILYIGSSRNIRKRVMSPNHWYIIFLTRLPNRLVYTKSITTIDYVNLEKELIALYRPLFNCQHNSGRLDADIVI